jgi:hypothetical protein
MALRALSIVSRGSLLVALFVAPHAAAQVAGSPVLVPPGRGAPPKGGIDARLFVVDDTPGCRFSGSVQAAVDAASDGDIVLVRPGTYSGGLVVDGKGVSVFGDPQGVANSVKLTGALSIRNLNADQSVALRDLKLDVTSASRTGNAGHLWIERCTLKPLTTIDPVSVEAGTAGFFDSECSAGISALNGAEMFAYHSRFYGAQGRDGYADCYGYCSASHYPYLYSAFCSSQDSTRGGSGVSLAGLARASLFGCEARGGRGGNEGGDFPGYCCYTGDCSVGCSNGGDGVNLSAGTVFTYMDLVAIGGPGPLGCSNGTPLAGSGSTTVLTGEVGSYSITGTLLSGASAQLTFRGPAGWNVFLTYSDEYAPVYLPDFKGTSVVSPEAPTIFIGQMPLSGELSTTVPFTLPYNQLAKVLYSQAKLYDTTTGTPYLAAPSAMLVLREPCP